MLAHAFLAIATAIERDHAPTPDQMIELAVNEFRRLFDGLLLDRERQAVCGEARILYRLGLPRDRLISRRSVCSARPIAAQVCWSAGAVNAGPQARRGAARSVLIAASTGRR